jgi:hypothetical protein
MKTLLNDGQLVDYNGFCRVTGVPFSANEYLSLIPAVTYARERYGNKERSNGKTFVLRIQFSHVKADPKNSEDIL